MPRFHNINGTKVQFTQAEETARDAEDVIWEAGAFDRAIADLRERRNKLLSQTDWVITKAKETATSIPVGMKTYRQELRDLPSGLTTVEEVQAVTFPVKP